MRILKLPMILAMTLALVVPAYRGPAAVGPARGVASAAVPAITVYAAYYTNPELPRIKNNRTYYITVRAIGSIYQPRSNEPFYKYFKLGPGKTVTFESGYAATAGNHYTLTRQYIYNNSVGTREGAKVITSAGTFYDRCG